MFISSTSRHEWDSNSQLLVVTSIDYTGSSKSNCHTNTITTVPYFELEHVFKRIHTNKTWITGLSGAELFKQHYLHYKIKQMYELFIYIVYCLHIMCLHKFSNSYKWSVLRSDLWVNINTMYIIIWNYRLATSRFYWSPFLRLNGKYAIKMVKTTDKGKGQKLRLYLLNCCYSDQVLSYQYFPQRIYSYVFLVSGCIVWIFRLWSYACIHFYNVSILFVLIF